EPDDGVDLGGLGGDHDDRHVGAAPQLAAHVQSGHRRQHDVEEHEVGVDLVEAVERLRPVAGDLDVEPLASEADGQGVDERLLVLADEHGDRSTRAAGSAVHDPPGSDSVNTEPTPSVDSSETAPRWLLMTWRTMARPSPVPPVRRERARSTR